MTEMRTEPIPFETNRLKRIDYKLSQIIANMRDDDDPPVTTKMFDSNRLKRVEQKVDLILEKVDIKALQQMADNISKYGQLDKPKKN